MQSKDVVKKIMNTEVEELQSLMPYVPDYHCEQCGEVLLKPVIRQFGYHITGGSPMLCGDFQCPNDRWWRYGHTRLHLEYVHCDLVIFKKGIFYERLWVHELDERRGGK